MNRTMTSSGSRRKPQAPTSMPIPTGPEIRKARQDRGISALELSKKAKVSRQSLMDWESGKRIPRYATVRKIMLYLDKQQLLPDLNARPKE